MTGDTASVPAGFTAPGVYFGRAYGEAAAAVEGGTWWLQTAASGRWLMPLVERQLETGVDGVSPYGYSGIWVDPELCSSDVLDAWAQAAAQLRTCGYISLFLRLDPLDEFSRQRLALLPELSLSRRSRTFSVRTGSSVEAWNSAQGRFRTAVRKAERLGMTAAVTRADSDVNALLAFRQLYDDTMTRVQASSAYMFDAAYYEKILGLRGALNLVCVQQGGDIVAAALLMTDSAVAHYHLAGSRPAAARDGANTLLLWSLVQWCSEQAIQRLHLGGGLTDGDSLAKFKQSLGRDEHEFWTAQVILRPDAYDAQCLARARELSVSLEEVRASSYFPAYRMRG